MEMENKTVQSLRAGSETVPTAVEKWNKINWRIELEKLYICEMPQKYFLLTAQLFQVLIHLENCWDPLVYILWPGGDSRSSFLELWWWCWWWLVSSCARLLGECLTIHSPPALFSVLKWRLVRAHKFHSLCQGQSTVAQQAETNVAECSLTSCVWALF